MGIPQPACRGFAGNGSSRGAARERRPVPGRCLSDLVHNQGAGGKFVGLRWPLLSVSICQEAFLLPFPYAARK